MNELTGGSDSAEIEVSKSRGVGGQMTMGGVFHVECFKPDGECFFSTEVPNLMTKEWALQMASMYAGALDGATEMDEGTGTIIGSLAGTSITYSATTGATAYGYYLELSTVETAAANTQTYATALTTTSALTPATRVAWGTDGIPLIYAGEVDGSTNTGNTYTATNQSADLTTTDERATWVKTGSTEAVKSVALYFTNTTAIGNRDGLSGTLAHNKMVARAILNTVTPSTGVSLESGDTIKVRYSILTAVAAS